MTYKAPAMNSTCRVMVFPCLSLLGATRGTPDSVPISSDGDRVKGGEGEGEGGCAVGSGCLAPYH